MICLKSDSPYTERTTAQRQLYLSVVDGLLRNANGRLVSVLALLDLSAATDMLDCPILILLQKLESTFGISGLRPT